MLECVLTDGLDATIQLITTLTSGAEQIWADRQAELDAEKAAEVKRNKEILAMLRPALIVVHGELQCAFNENRLMKI